jgi:signal transduction histidine kinase
VTRRRGCEAEAPARRVRLEARIGAHVPAARCAPEKVERVLYNLLTNAIRHTPWDGSVAVLVEPSGEEVRVSVEDTGDGFSGDAAGGCRALLARRPARTRTGGGAGLGPAIARGLVEAHGRI